MASNGTEYHDLRRIEKLFCQLLSFLAVTGDSSRKPLVSVVIILALQVCGLVLIDALSTTLMVVPAILLSLCASFLLLFFAQSFLWLYLDGKSVKNIVQWISRKQLSISNFSRSNVTTYEKMFLILLLLATASFSYFSVLSLLVFTCNHLAELPQIRIAATEIIAKPSFIEVFSMIFSLDRIELLPNENIISHVIMYIVQAGRMFWLVAVLPVITQSTSLILNKDSREL